MNSWASAGTDLGFRVEFLLLLSATIHHIGFLRTLPCGGVVLPLPHGCYLQTVPVSGNDISFYYGGSGSVRG